MIKKILSLLKIWRYTFFINLYEEFKKFFKLILTLAFAPPILVTPMFEKIILDRQLLPQRLADNMLILERDKF